jgi:histidine phosphotransferase ChpT
MSVKSQPLDPVSLSALVASRLCHDLINPVGALSSGLEVLDDQSMEQAMKEAALDLIRSGGSKSIALLKYARLAYGASGGRGAELPMEEAESALREVYKWTKAELVWKVPPGLAAKEKVKALLVLAYAAADCVPRGGMVTVSGSRDSFTVEATGARTILNEELGRALAGDTTDIKPKFAPAYIAGLAAREAGGAVSAILEGGRVVMRAKFANAGAFAAAR